MYKKILALLSLIVIVSCSSNPVSVEKLNTFDLGDFKTFNVVISDKSEDVKVSPFTSQGLKKSFADGFEMLGLVKSLDTPDFKAVISLTFDEKNKRYRGRRNPYFYDPFYDDYFYDQTDRSILRLTLYDGTTGDPLWTGLRSTKYVDSQLQLDAEEIKKYVDSFLSELVGG